MQVSVKKQSNKTRDVMVKCPVRLYNGRFIIRQCFPKLRFEKPKKRQVVGTVVDRENKLRESLFLIRLVGGGG